MHTQHRTKGMHSTHKSKEMYTAHSKEHTGVAHSRKLGGAHSPQQKAHSSGDAAKLCVTQRTQKMQKIANETGDAHTARKLHTGPEF